MTNRCTAAKTGKHKNPRTESECPVCGTGTQKSSSQAVTGAPSSTLAHQGNISDSGEFFEALYESFKDRSRDLGTSFEGGIPTRRWEADVPNDKGTITVERKIDIDYDPTAENYGLIRDSRFVLKTPDGQEISSGTADMDPEYVGISSESRQDAESEAKKLAEADREDSEVWSDWDWIVEGEIGDWLEENYR